MLQTDGHTGPVCVSLCYLLVPNGRGNTKHFIMCQHWTASSKCNLLDGCKEPKQQSPVTIVAKPFVAVMNKNHLRGGASSTQILFDQGSLSRIAEHQCVCKLCVGMYRRRGKHT